MSILLAQLGDIHFKTNTDPAVMRAPYIGAAIAAEVTKDTTSVVIAICGDATYSGTHEQFEVVKDFLIRKNRQPKYIPIKISLTNC